MAGCGLHCTRLRRLINRRPGCTTCRMHRLLDILRLHRVHNPCPRDSPAATASGAVLSVTPPYSSSLNQNTTALKCPSAVKVRSTLLHVRHTRGVAAGFVADRRMSFTVSRQGSKTRLTAVPHEVHRLQSRPDVTSDANLYRSYKAGVVLTSKAVSVFVPVSTLGMLMTYDDALRAVFVHCLRHLRERHERTDEDEDAHGLGG